jgi:hypothetical protein
LLTADWYAEGHRVSQDFAEAATWYQRAAEQGHETAFEQTIRSLDPFFAERWTRLTPLQQKTLTAVLHGKGERMRPAEIAHSIKSPASSVRSALRALYNRNILWDDWSLRKLRVRPQDPFWGHWIRMRAILGAPAPLITTHTACEA